MKHVTKLKDATTSMQTAQQDLANQQTNLGIGLRMLISIALLIGIMEALNACGDVVDTTKSGTIDPNLVRDPATVIWLMLAAPFSGVVGLDTTSNLAAAISKNHSIFGDLLGRGNALEGRQVVGWSTTMPIAAGRLMVVRALGIDLRLALLDPKHIRSFGSKTAQLYMNSAFYITLSAAITVFFASQFDLPFSSAHIAAGGVCCMVFLNEYIKFHRIRLKAEIDRQIESEDTSALPTYVKTYCKIAVTDRASMIRSLQQHEGTKLEHVKKELRGFSNNPTAAFGTAPSFFGILWLG